MTFTTDFPGPSAPTVRIALAGSGISTLKPPRVKSIDLRLLKAQRPSTHVIFGGCENLSC